jgi:hypothetical protein
MTAYEKINCRVHGEQQRTYVCQHIFAGLVARERVGFFWAIDDPDNPRADAYCKECNARGQKTGGEWTGEALELLQPKTLCGVCYDLAKQFHMGGNPWS